MCLFCMYTSVCIHMHMSLSGLKHFSGDPTLSKAAAVIKKHRFFLVLTHLQSPEVKILFQSVIGSF